MNKQRKITIHGKLTALKYLIDRSVYKDEWSGAGMYEAIEEVFKAKDTGFDKRYLDRLLKEASEF